MADKESKIHQILKMLANGNEPAVWMAALAKEKPSGLMKLLTDTDLPDEVRAELLRQIQIEHPDLGKELTKTLVNMACNDTAKEHKKKAAQLQEILEAMEAGPMRFGRFLRFHREGTVTRAQVVLHDGSPAYVLVPDEKLAAQLRAGDGVLVDGQGRAVLYRDPAPPACGGQAVLDRRIGPEAVLVTLSHDEPRVLIASQDLRDKLDGGTAQPGSQILINAQQEMAFDVLPETDQLSHYRHLDRRPVPLKADMGAPPAYIDRMLRHAQLVMERPHLIQRWKQPLARFVLLEGTTGSGKTLSISVLQRKTAELVEHVTGVPIDQQPPRVLRLRPWEVYEKWVGSSDRNMARFFQEVEQVASTPLVSVDGREYKAPTFAVIEEMEAVAAVRGQGDPIFDRIMSTLLQHLDPTRPEVNERFVFWIASTNLLRQIDSAALRRIGAVIEKFRHLSRAAFADVLGKHIQGLPLAPQNGVTDQARLLRATTAALTQWLYCSNGQDTGQVKVVYANGEPEIKGRRDFLTGAVVARSVQQAADRGCAGEFERGESAGLTPQNLMDAFSQQVQSMAEQLSPQNIASVIEVREGGHVSDVVRLRQPTVAPFQLRRAI